MINTEINTRYKLTINKEFKSLLESLKENNESLNSLMIRALEEYVSRRVG